MGARAAVAGASGYAGGELLRLLAGHPEIEVVAATAHSQAGTALGAVHPHLASLADLVLAPTAPDALSGVDVVFLALPHGESAALAAGLPAGVKVVDLGADHRLRDPGDWQRYYGGPHAGAWTYGLPELPGQRDAIARSARVANTGCYAVSVILALAPLIAAGIADPEDVVVVASSGTSGAGRGLKPHLLATEVMGDLSPYKVGAHQHAPPPSATPSPTPTRASRSCGYCPRGRGRTRRRRTARTRHCFSPRWTPTRGGSWWCRRSTTSARARPARRSSAPT
jgi:N-acetyl-gamma-glutamyl-phosphate reductase